MLLFGPTTQHPICHVCSSALQARDDGFILCGLIWTFINSFISFGLSVHVQCCVVPAQWYASGFMLSAAYTTTFTSGFPSLSIALIWSMIVTSISSSSTLPLIVVVLPPARQHKHAPQYHCVACWPLTARLELEGRWEASGELFVFKAC